MKIYGILQKLINSGAPPYHPEVSPRFEGGITAEKVVDILSDCSDLEKRDILIGGDAGLPATLFFIDGLVSGGEVSELVLKPLTDFGRFSDAVTAEDAVNAMMSGAVFDCSAEKRDTLDGAISDILSGSCLVIPRGLNTAVSFEAKSTEKRSISEPTEEKSIKGSKDSFSETVKTNTMLVRRHLHSPDLKIRKLTVGRRTNTTVNIVFLRGVTDISLVDALDAKLRSVDVDGVITSADIEEVLADSPSSPFPQIIFTERPDRFCLNLLEGRAGILIDGLPFGFSVPGTFSQFMKVPEDRANHFLVSSLVQLVRYASFLITLLLPALYTAISMYHQEMIPTKLLESTIEAKKAVPFPVAVEILAMLASFELLQEAGMRLPTKIGQTISIVGALIVGQSAVEAKVVSPIAVIVVAVAGIAGYTMPSQDMANALRLCRFLILIASIFAGMFGIALGFSLFLFHLCSLESFGVPYMTPLAGRFGGKSVLQMLRPPLNLKKTRERALNTPDRRCRK